MPLILKIKLMYPKMLAIFLMLLTVMPYKIISLPAFLPMIDVIFIYYWCLYKPQIVQNWFVFIIGILRDIISINPVGVSALTYLVIRQIILYKRNEQAKYKHLQLFSTIWKGFAVIALISILCKWVLLSILSGELFSLQIMILHLTLSILVYPIFHSIFNMIFVTIPKDLNDVE